MVVYCFINPVDDGDGKLTVTDSSFSQQIAFVADTFEAPISVLALVVARRRLASTLINVCIKNDEFMPNDHANSISYK